MRFFGKMKKQFNEAAAMLRANNRSALFAEEDAHRRMIPHNKTHVTDMGIGRDVDGPFSWSLKASEDTSWFLEFGTRDHPITPTPDHLVRAATEGHDAFLHWIDPVAGPVYATSVWHPGQRSTPILRPAIRDNADTFSRFIQEEVAKEWD